MSRLSGSSVLTGSTGMPVPAARGELSELLVGAVRYLRIDGCAVVAAARRLAEGEEPIHSGEDAQIALLMLYELHYRGLAGAPEDWEWDTDLLICRRLLERRFESELRELATVDDPGGDVAEVLFDMTAPTRGPSLSRYVAARATKEQLLEFLIHRSVYQLKEADPHSWAIPRLAGTVKAALVEVQIDEYGGGRADRMHSALFAQTMRELGLDDSYGAMVDQVPAVTLATVNAMSMFGLNRRLLGAIVGHLAAFEMTSSLPNRMYGNGLRRVGYGPEATRFFDEHVEADAVHEQIAGRDLAGGLVAQQPERRADVLFGAAACLALDEFAGRHLLSAWENQLSSLREIR